MQQQGSRTFNLTSVFLMNLHELGQILDLLHSRFYAELYALHKILHSISVKINGQCYSINTARVKCSFPRVSHL